MWTDKYIGLNYIENGRGPDGYDCWGLARLVYKQEYDIELPSFVESYTSSDSEYVAELISRNIEGWEPVEEPVAGDIVLFNVLGHLAHVGVVVSKTTFLHIREGSDSVLESFDNHRWNKRVQGYYRYKKSAQLVALPHPLKTEKLTADIPPGTTLQELVNKFIETKNIPPQLVENSYIFVNGIKVLPENWSSYTLNSGDCVEYRAVPKGRNAFRLILTIALIYITIQYGPQVGAALTPTGTSAATANFVGTVVINTIGQALINAIAPPIVNSPDQRNSREGREQLMVTGAQNQLLRYGTIPIVLGKVKITPPLGAQTYISFPNESDVYLNTVLTWGYGPLYINSATLKIGENSFNSYSDVVIETHDRQQEPSTTQINRFKEIYSSDTEQVYHNQQLVYPGHQAPYIRINSSIDQLIFKTDLTGSTTPVQQTLSCFTENILNPNFQWQVSSDNVNWSNIPGATTSLYNFSQTYKNSYIRVLVGGSTTNGSGGFVSVNLSNYVKFTELFEQPNQSNTRRTFPNADHIKIICNRPEVLYKASSTGFANIELTTDQEVRFRVYGGTEVLIPEARKSVNGYTISVSNPTGVSNNVKDYLVEGNDIVLPKPDTISSDPATVTVTFSVNKYRTPDSGQGYDIVFGGPASVLGGTVYKPIRSIFNSNLTDEGGWVVSAFNNSEESPADRLEIAVQFPQGVRSVKTEGDGAGRSSAAEALVKARIKYQGDTTWTPIPELTLAIVGVYKDAFTKTVSYIIPETKRALPFEVGVRRESPSDPNLINKYSQYYQSVLQTVTTFKTVGQLIIDPPDCKIAKSAVSIRASNQLSGSLPGINAEATSVCRVFIGSNAQINDGGGSLGLWSSEQPTSNPAALFLHVLMHPANPRRITVSEAGSKIDIKQLQRWYRYCEDPIGMRGLQISEEEVPLYQFRYNNVITSQTSLLEVLRGICSAGRASPYLVDGKWSVVIDEPKDIVQHFSPHNSWNFESNKSIVEMPHAIKGKFYNKNKNYQQDELIVYNLGRTVENSTLFEEMELTGITDPDLVYDHIKWHFAQAKVRPETYTINTDIEYLVCNRGDRVKVLHDVPMWGSESGRIKYRLPLQNGSSTTGVTDVYTLTEKITYETTKNYVFRIRSNTGASITTNLKTTFNAISYSRAGVLVKLYLSVNFTHPLQVGDVVTINSSDSSINTNNAVIEEIGINFIKYNKTGAFISDNQPVTITGTISLNDGYYKTVQFDTPFNVSNCDIDNLFLYGEVNRESQDLVVLGIEPASGTKAARLTLIDYGISTVDSVYNLFTGYRNFTENTVFNSLISETPILLINNLDNKYPNIDSSKIKSDESVIDIIGPNTYIFNIVVPFTNNKPDGTPLDLPSTVKFIEAHAKTTQNPISDESNLIKATALINEGFVKITGVNEQVDYYIRARYLSEDGNIGPWTTWTTHTVAGRSTPPSNVSGFYYVITDMGIELNWIPNQDIDYSVTEIREGTEWSSASIVFRGNASTYTIQRPESGVYTYLAKHFDLLGKESPQAAVTSVEFNNLTLSYLIVDLTNDNHMLPTDSSGAQVSSYAFSGTQIRVYDGLNLLRYDETGTDLGTWKIDSVDVVEEYESTPGVFEPVAVPGQISPVQDQTLGDAYAVLEDLQSMLSNADKATIVFTIMGTTVLGEEFTITKNQNIVKSRSNPLYKLEVVTPIVAKDSVNNVTDGEYSTIVINGNIWTGSSFEPYGWIGLTPYVDSTPGEELLFYRNVNYTPLSTDQTTGWLVKLYGEDSSGDIVDTLILDREEIRVIYKAVNYDVEIESTNGTVFKLGQGLETTLIAHVFENETEITDILPASRFRWRRVSRNPQPFPNDDASWNLLYFSGYKIITVTVADVSAIATFHCDILSE